MVYLLNQFIFYAEVIDVIYNNILEALGNTPMIRLNRIAPEDGADIYVKYEGLNVGGSVKTRTAFNDMLNEAEKQGIITKDTIIVEPTSGNQGIGIALVGAVKGYKVKIIMPDSVSEERRMLVPASMGRRLYLFMTTAILESVLTSVLTPPLK